MVEKLSIQIALEGGDEVKRQLAEMGEAGQTAFQHIAEAAAEAGGFAKLDPSKLAQFTAELKKLGVSTAELGKLQKVFDTALKTEQMVNNAQAAEKAVTSLSRTLSQVTAVLGVVGIAFTTIAIAVAGFVKLAGNAAEAIGKVEAEAAKTGMSIEKYDQLRAALTGVGISAKGTAERIQEVADASDAAKIAQVTEAVKKLQEVMATGSDPRTSPALQQLLTMAQGFGPVADAAKKALTDLNIQFTASEQKLQQMASSGLQSLQQLAAGIDTTALGPGRSFVGVLNEISTGGDTAGAKLMAFVRQLEAIRDPAERNAFALKEAGQGGLEMAKAVNTGAISSKQSIEELTKGVTTLNQGMANSASSFEQAANKMASALDRALTVKVWENFGNNATTAINVAAVALDGLILKLNQAASAAAGVFPSGPAMAPQAPGHAHGGMIGGRGTGTSDSNLAWVSRGEHIMPARAVAQPGVLAFLEALRRSGGNLSRVLDRMGHFATGGLVTMPALAGGGLGSMSHVTIAFPGLPEISGLRASSGVVEQLQRAAAMAQVRSGGRKPSRYS
jgi:hypothetical protein